MVCDGRTAISTGTCRRLGRLPEYGFDLPEAPRWSIATVRDYPEDAERVRKVRVSRSDSASATVKCGCQFDGPPGGTLARHRFRKLEEFLLAEVATSPQIRLLR
jgi:hypothetical protein